MKRRIGWHAATLLALIAGCHHDIDATDGAFYAWDDRKVHCAVDLDTFARNDAHSIESGLDRAADRGEVVELYAHDPGNTVEWSTIESVLAGAQQRGLAFYTYADIAHGTATPGPGILLSFDDASVDDWVSGLDLFARYNARLTFFVAYFPTLSESDRAGLHLLADAGHALEAHSIHHLRAPLYVEQKGLKAYMQDEVLPSIDAMRADGFDDGAYAYPYGARTSEIDDAVLKQVQVVRSVSFPWSGPADPCPQ